LDLCTGSGCIGIAIKKLLPKALKRSNKFLYESGAGRNSGSFLFA
jgi:methylase of polypeptide subunit release factors